MQGRIQGSEMGVNFCNNIREIKYYFNILGIRKNKKDGGSEKGGGVKIHPFHLPWIHAWNVRQGSTLTVVNWTLASKYHTLACKSLETQAILARRNSLKCDFTFRINWELFAYVTWKTLQY